MPYIVLRIPRGHSAEARKEALIALSRDVCTLLDAGLADTLAYAQEYDPNDLCVGGAAPAQTGVLVTIMMSKGRPPVVLRRLIEVVTDAAERTLDVSRRSIHCVLQENDPSDVAVGGIPLGFPNLPRWLVDQQA